jgi:hypothetical protein
VGIGSVIARGGDPPMVLRKFGEPEIAVRAGGVPRVHCHGGDRTPREDACGDSRPMLLGRLSEQKLPSGPVRYVRVR